MYRSSLTLLILFNEERANEDTSDLKPKKLSRLLVAVDGSDTSMNAADYAITLAKNNNNNNEAAEIFVINDIDLIVVGTKGRSGMTKAVLGSVASKVVTYSPCSVLVVR